MKMPKWGPSALLIAGCLFVVVSELTLSGASRTWCVLIGAGMSLCGLPTLFRSRAVVSGVSPDLNERDPEAQKKALEEWRQTQVEQFRVQAEQLQDRQRNLLEQLAQVQEFLEYPISGAPTNEDPEVTVRLSEQDRQVHALLESEGEKIYEKIRANAYTKDGNVDIPLIRAEVFELVRKVARIYSPDSTNPLLETSFEQLARSASRICLHALVLLEQLPLDVKSYNIREMYGYIRKAVQGYGTYQQVAPWLKHLTRGAYVGRIAAGTNPVSLGAWWLATEVGRRGAQKLVENVVDRQAVAALNDIVAIIGVEVANVYGPGFRQRDAAWVFGAELTELLHRFPVSRDSLSQGLREITALPLRSEYDRIYLYRCVADHRSSGLRIADPAVLTRVERDQIAVQLEKFFSSWIHGVTPEDQEAWQQDVESRLDLRLNFHQNTMQQNLTDAAPSVRAVYVFLTSVAGASEEDAKQHIEVDDLITHVPVAQRSALLASLAPTHDSHRFEPPDLEPSSELTTAFLNSLMRGSIVVGCDASVEELLLETACYFRRSREEAAELFEAALSASVQMTCTVELPLRKLNNRVLRVLASNIKQGDSVLAVYEDIAIVTTEHHEDLADAVLCVLKIASKNEKRLILIQPAGVAWTSASGFTASREKGFLIDDCRISGGAWDTVINPLGGSIVVSGSITGGGYRKYFDILLLAAP